MLFRGALVAAALIATAASAWAQQAPVERGKYLVTTILTCQNCHTPRQQGGVFNLDRDLSSGPCVCASCAPGLGLHCDVDPRCNADPAQWLPAAQAPPRLSFLSGGRVSARRRISISR